MSSSVSTNMPVPMAVVTTQVTTIARGRLVYTCPANTVVGLVMVPPSTSWLPPSGHTLVPAGSLTIGATVQP